MEVLKALFGILLPSSIAIAVIGWLVRSLVTHFMSKDIEKYKLELKANSDKEIEHLRSDLRIHALEHEVRFRKLHEKVAEAVAEVYGRLFKLFQAVTSYVNPVDLPGQPDKEGKGKLVQAAAEEFFSYFNANRLFLPKDLSQRVHEFSDQLKKISWDFSVGLHKEQHGKISELQDLDHWEKGIEGIKKVATPLFDKLHDEFQRVLGFDPQSKEADGVGDLPH